MRSMIGDMCWFHFCVLNSRGELHGCPSQGSQQEAPARRPQPIGPSQDAQARRPQPGSPCQDAPASEPQAKKSQKPGSPKKPQEAPISSRKPQEAPGGTRRLQEIPGSTRKPQESEEALGDPMGAQDTCLVSCVGSLGGISSRVEKH